jgi:hypothetical protein
MVVSTATLASFLFVAVRSMQLRRRRARQPSSEEQKLIAAPAAQESKAVASALPALLQPFEFRVSPGLFLADVYVSMLHGEHKILVLDEYKTTNAAVEHLLRSKPTVAGFDLVRVQRECAVE